MFSLAPYTLHTQTCTIWRWTQLALASVSTYSDHRICALSNVKSKMCLLEIPTEHGENISSVLSLGMLFFFFSFILLFSAKTLAGREGVTTKWILRILVIFGYFWFSFSFSMRSRPSTSASLSLLSTSSSVVLRSQKPHTCISLKSKINTRTHPQSTSHIHTQTTNYTIFLHSFFPSWV